MKKLVVANDRLNYGVNLFKEGSVIFKGVSGGREAYRYCKIDCRVYCGFILVLENLYSFIFKGRFVAVDGNDVEISAGI